MKRALRGVKFYISCAVSSVCDNPSNLRYICSCLIIPHLRCFRYKNTEASWNLHIFVKLGFVKVVTAICSDRQWRKGTYGFARLGPQSDWPGVFIVKWLYQSSLTARGRKPYVSKTSSACWETFVPPLQTSCATLTKQQQAMATGE